MMEKLIFTNGRGEKIVFSPQSAFWVDVSRDVTGLNDVVNELYINQLGGQSGSVFTGYRHKQKEIKIKGSIFAKNNKQLRQYVMQLNKVLLPDEKSYLSYDNAGKKRSIACVAEVAPTYHLGEVLASFSIELQCLEPYWRDDAEINSLLAHWHPNFEFPLCIDESDGIELGRREESLIINVHNAGDVDTPSLIRFSAAGDVENPEILNIKTGEYIKMNFTMQYGDIIEVSTHSGKKAVTLKRGGMKRNIISHLAQGSSFIQLHSKDNLFRYHADSGLEALDIVVLHNNLYLTCYMGG